MDREEFVKEAKLNHTAQEIHDMLMEETGGNPGSSPGYSKATMARILYEVRK